MNIFINWSLLFIIVFIIVMLYKQKRSKKSTKTVSCHVEDNLSSLPLLREGDWKYEKGVWIQTDAVSSMVNDIRKQSTDAQHDERNLDFDTGDSQKISDSPATMCCSEKQSIDSKQDNANLDCDIENPKILRYDDPSVAKYYSKPQSSSAIGFDQSTLQHIISHGSHCKSKYSSYYNAFEYILYEIPKANIIVDRNAFYKNINISGYSIKTEQPAGYGYFPSSYVVVDVETTGLVPGQNKIVQITAIRFHNHEADSIFTTYINPCCKIPHESTKIHGITDDMVKDAPEFHQIIASLDNFIGNYDLVGHNIFFDIKFMRKFGYDNELRGHKYYDTLELSRYFDTEIYSHTLNSACEYHDIISYRSHDSSVDALATALLYQSYIKSAPNVVALNKYKSLQKAFFAYQSNQKG